MESPGPKPKANSLKQNSVKKAFYVKKDNWSNIESYSTQENKTKALIINEA